MPDTPPTVYIVDDDSGVRTALMRLVASVGLRGEAFASPQAFLEHAPLGWSACVVLDVRMPGMSGLELQKALGEWPRALPVIFVTGHADVPLSVRAMKQGAIDFLAKPFNDQDMLDAIHHALERDRDAVRTRTEQAAVRVRYDSLTPRERDVYALVVTGPAQ